MVRPKRVEASLPFQRHSSAIMAKELSGCHGTARMTFILKGAATVRLLMKFGLTPQRAAASQAELKQKTKTRVVPWRFNSDGNGTADEGTGSTGGFGKGWYPSSSSCGVVGTERRWAGGRWAWASWIQ